MRTRRSQSSSDPMPVRPALRETKPDGHRPSTSVVGDSARAGHTSVLLHEAVELLQVQKDDTVVDATLGGAGHARALVEKLSSRGTFIGIDADSDAISRSKEALKDAKPTIHLIQGNFRNLASDLNKSGIDHITKALFDLGWSSYQLDSGRGFSFLKDEPLHMGYDKDQVLTAATIVNTWKEESIADVLYGWGEERYSRRIAKAIVEYRIHSPIKTSSELAEIIKRAVPAGYRYGRIHPATRSFQALRIAVNDELGALKQGLRAAWTLLSSGGRIAVISFHSIEDRLVKQLFAELERSGEGLRITKKPLTPTFEEIKDNPRARSAKLRVIEKNQDHASTFTKNKQIQPLDISGEA